MIQAVRNPINRLLKPKVSSTDLGRGPEAGDRGALATTFARRWERRLDNSGMNGLHALASVVAKRCQSRSQLLVD